jgi:UDP-glucose 4-epimerase
MKVDRVLILGDTGLIGGAVRRRLEARMPPGTVQGRSMPEVDLCQSDHMDRLAGLFNEKTAVVMCAGVKRQLGDSPGIFLQNVQMVVNVCNLLQKHPVGRFIYFSSAAVYGEDVNNVSINENTPVCLRSYYGIAKHSSELLLGKVHTSLNQEKLLLLRPPLVYGPGDGGAFYGPSGFIKDSINEDPIILWGDGSELREFVFSEDAAEIVERLIFGRTFGVLNLVSGRSSTFAQVLDIVSRLQGRPVKYRSRDRTKEKVDNAYVNKKLANALPDFQFTTLEDGMRRTWEAFRHKKQVTR